MYEFKDGDRILVGDIVVDWIAIQGLKIYKTWRDAGAV